MVSQIYQLSFPLTVILLLLSIVSLVVIFVSVRWCLRITCSVISVLSQRQSLNKQPVDDAVHSSGNITHTKEE